jgi:hypothetical protein
MDPQNYLSALLGGEEPQLVGDVVPLPIIPRETAGPASREQMQAAIDQIIANRSRALGGGPTTNISDAWYRAFAGRSL